MRAAKFHRRPFLTAPALCALLFAASAGYAQTVISRTRIGGYAEDIAYASGGKLKDNIIITDGYEIYAVPDASKKAKEPPARLFDVRAAGFDLNPRGIAYVESEDLIAANDATHPSKLFLFDAQGQLRETRKITYMGGYEPQFLEGMAYIPAGSALYPDHLIQVALDTPAGPSRIEVLTRGGQVVKEILPSWPAGSDTDYMGDVAFLAPNKLLVTFYDNSIWTIDFNGNVLAGPQIYPGVNGFEGLVRLADGRFVGVGFPQSLVYFDAGLSRQPDDDRRVLVGLNLNRPLGVAWNSDTNRHMIVHDVRVDVDGTSAYVSSVPATLDGATQFVNLGAGGFPVARTATYLAAEHLFGVVHANGPRAILLYNPDGTLNGQVDLSAATIGQNLGGANAVTHIPTTNEFAVTFNGNPTPDPAAERRRVRVVSRAGALVRTIDLTCTGATGVAGLAYFDDPGGGGGRFIILASAGRVLVTDLNGHLLREFNLRVKLGIVSGTDVAAVTTGPQAGAFSVIDANAGELVVFRLD
jgi:hypothetical protein